MSKRFLIALAISAVVFSVIAVVIQGQCIVLLAKRIEKLEQRKGE